VFAASVACAAAPNEGIQYMAKHEDARLREHEVVRLREIWRFADLKLLGIVADRATVRRWVASEGFPKPIVLSANSIGWPSAEVREWLASRPRGAAPQPSRSREGAAVTQIEKGAT
jgi:predicted DNA-binding transcriptional regulator AlpA